MDCRVREHDQMRSVMAMVCELDPHRGQIMFDGLVGSRASRGVVGCGHRIWIGSGVGYATT